MSIEKYKLIKNISAVLGKKPITADFFLTNFCNNRCKYCTYKRWDKSRETARSISFEDFTRYTQILLHLGVQGIILTGGGEPTLCYDFDRICAWLEENRIPYGINTNFNVIKYIAPKYLKVSLDGYDRDSYGQIRGVDRYDDVVRNIREYAQWKRINKIPTSLGVQGVASDPQFVREFYWSVKKLDVDYIAIRPVESTCGEFYEDPQHEVNRQRCVEELENISSFDKRVIVNFKWYEPKTKFDSCRAQWSQIALDECGNVMYCCHKPYEIVCHITDCDVMDKKASYQTMMNMCDVPCRLTGANETMRLIESDLDEKMFV